MGRELSAELPVPDGPEAVTPEWLTAALADSGVLRHGHVTEARWQRIGQDYGFTGVIGRVQLRYENAGGDAPASLIAKLPMVSDDAVSGYRRMQEQDPERAARYYARCKCEARFYLEIPVAFAPNRYYAAVDRERGRVVILLEDVSGGRQGDVLHGCSVEDAELVVDQVAPFHARWWGERAPASEFPRSGCRCGRARGTQSDAHPRRPPPRQRDLRRPRRRPLCHPAGLADRLARVAGLGCSDVLVLVAQRRGSTCRRAGVARPLPDASLHARRPRLLGRGSWARVPVGPARPPRGHGRRGRDVRPDDATSRERALQEDALAADGRLVAALSDHNAEGLLRAL